MKTQLGLLEASVQGFDNHYGKGKYQLPQNYNEGQVLARLESFYGFFLKVQD